MKMSKVCEITLSADVFTTKQNLGKHSTVHSFIEFILSQTFILGTQWEILQGMTLKLQLKRTQDWKTQV